MPVYNMLPHSGGGSYLKGAWTATASGGVNTRLTAIITLTEGSWLIHFKVPVATGSLLYGISVDSNTFYNGGMYFDGIAICKVPAGQTQDAYITCAQGSQSVTYSYLERGFIEALKLG